MLSVEHISDLLLRHLQGTITPAEQVEIDAWIGGSAARRQFFASITDEEDLREQILSFRPEREAATEAAILEKIMTRRAGSRAPVHRVHFLKTAWVRYAAAIIILLGVGTYLYINNNNTKEISPVTQTDPAPVQNDVAPGGNKAILTLGNGQQIVLDSAANGELAREQSAVIRKTASGSIEYLTDNAATAQAAVLNTMTTPRGGQYHLVLPDGTGVWLNAQSSITYPTAFTGSGREVTVTGEAYFEVRKKAGQPFRVKVADRSLAIEVLGTHFNVHAYPDEPAIQTTLLEGSVRLRNDVHTSLILKPGQQGQLTDRKLSLAAHPDISQVMAWKNGLFNFNDVSLPDAMQQLARWYDVEVVYEGSVPPMKFGGKVGRDLNLSQVLKGLDVMGVKFRIEGKKLVVPAG